MNDYRDLFGGMTAGVALLAAYIVCWGAITSAHGAEISIEGPQPVPIGDLGRPQYIPSSGDLVVVGDAPFVLISVSEWERLTNTIEKVLAIAERRHANDLRTDEGRQRWHGELVDKVQTDDGKGLIFTYADGFTYTEKARAAVKASPAVQKVRKATQVPRPPKVERDAPARLQAKQAAVSALPAAKEVNATFGPGGKVIKVEGE